MKGHPKILVVDDEPRLAAIVGQCLEREGFEVSSALTGEEALAKARSVIPDLIILDIMLPKVDGYEVCRILKQKPAYRKIPIILFTAKTRPSDERLGFEAGADAYVRKPFVVQELLGTVRSLLAKSPPSSRAKSESSGETQEGTGR